MEISQNRLWKPPVDRKMSTVDLRKATGIVPNTMARLSRDEDVSMGVLINICTVLNANIGDVMGLIPAVDTMLDE